MIKKLLIIISMMITFNAFAYEPNWSQIDDIINKEAKIEETPFGLFASIKLRTPIHNGEQRDYLTGIGGFEGSYFKPYRYEIVSETWIIKDNHFHIDQWLFALNSENKLTFYLHRRMVQNSRGVILEMENIPHNDSEYNHKIDNLLKDWEDRYKNRD